MKNRAKKWTTYCCKGEGKSVTLRIQNQLTMNHNSLVSIDYLGEEQLFANLAYISGGSYRYY